MKFSQGLGVILGTTTLALVQYQPVSALTPAQVNDIAKQITVMIGGLDGKGSGVIIAKNGNTYTVLTANHVVKKAGVYDVITHDGQKYPMESAQTLGKLDLALVRFTSSKNYPPAKIADSRTVKEGATVYYAGFPTETANQLRRYRFIRADITGRSQNQEGYELSYNGQALPGMSGGPVLNEEGLLIAIHGQAETRDIKIQGFLKPEIVGVQGIPTEKVPDLDSIITKGISSSNQQPNSVPTISLNDAGAYNRRGVLYYEQKKWELALADYTKAIQLNPSYTAAYYNRGWLYKEQKKWELALADFTKYIELDPDSDTAAESYHQLGNIYNALGNKELAIANYTKAIAIVPKFAWAYLNRGSTYQKLGKYELALADFNKAININPNFSFGYYLRGWLYRRQEKQELALADFTKYIELDPDSDTAAQAYLQLGNIYSGLGNNELAIANYTKAIAIIPNFFWAYLNRGAVYTEQKKWGLALADYTKLIGFFPDSGRAYRDRGDVYKQLGDKQKAKEDYLQAARLFLAKGKDWNTDYEEVIKLLNSL
ncbi:tetratricopeptide repeat-containing S1 family peptidase [Cuspidothrix issatschenkoi]|uniref:Uncharacterized protein n=1 Tax=Cuspidothrix issatschenkoi CHARLIE-1 TaxID=2052836 RepID=A0A2S6CYN2_9CYAN|nr:tetratricopeptide repeat-containing serine protease family protein [Cuspidothrix issatschenkoi]PPJ64832.1 hypothetical protein CUN59_02650 [Cuspidothrix issatschenkoi CHARLIE-1]